VSTTVAAAYDAAAAAWSAAPARIYGRLADRALACSPVPLRGRLVLDVGTGTGVAADALAAAGATAVATDLSFGMLSLDRKARPPAAQADVLHLPFARAAFGGVMASFVLNHLDDPASALIEAARVTAPGGVVIASAYADDDAHPVRGALQHALIESGWSPEPWYAHVRTVTIPNMATAAACEVVLAAAGLVGEVTHLRVAFPELDPDDLLDWRFGMAQYAAHLRTLDRDAIAAIRGRARDALGDQPPVLERSILVIAAAV
jgi:ubiquinone/menaquinone biosynthesis C-methylase UbiE